MRVVYIAAPLTAPTRELVQQNRARAMRWCAWAVAQGVAPVADWIILTGVLEETPENRELGLRIDCTLIERCDELWQVGGRISAGMAIEAAHAYAHGKRVVDFTHLGEEPPA